MTPFYYRTLFRAFGLAALLGSTRLAPAQDALYFANGDRMLGAQILEATEEKLKFAVRRGESMVSYTYRRENVLLAFNQSGHFLVVSDLDADPQRAQQQITEFRAQNSRPAETDFLVKSVPVTVIPALISYESDEVVNYKTPQGSAASIGKGELVAVLYRDGRHQFPRGVIEAAPLMSETRRQLKTGGSSAPVVAATPPPSAPVAAAPVVSPPVATPVPISAPVAVSPPPVQTATAEAPPSGVVSDKTKPSLNAEEYKTYRTKALRKVDEFAVYLNVITDKTLSSEEKDKAIDQAARLFMPKATIEVTSSHRSGAHKYFIREYLNRLKLLPYASTNVEWSEIQYVKELTQAADGNYYGTITGQQTFIGYGAGNDVLYSDVTQKNVRVKLQSYQKLVDGQGQVNWDVLLGNIGVVNK